MKLTDLEDIVSVVSSDFFAYKNPGFSPVENPKSLQTCIDDTVFIINKFISYFNKMADEQSD